MYFISYILFVIVYLKSLVYMVISIFNVSSNAKSFYLSLLILLYAFSFLFIFIDITLCIFLFICLY